MPNFNRETGIPFGVIAMMNIDPDLAYLLFYGAQAIDVTYERVRVEEKARIEREVAESGLLDPVDAEVEVEVRLDEVMERVQIEEPVIHGTLHGVTYQIDWLGGAALLWVLHSPVIGNYARCSPCVPGAGDLDNPGDYQCYDVPLDWRREE